MPSPPDDFAAAAARSARNLRLNAPTLLLARQVFDQNRRDMAACLHTADLLLALHRPADVLDCLDRLDASVAREALWHLVRANALSALRDERQAAREGVAALAKAGPSQTPLHQRALLQLGRSLTRLQEFGEARWCHQMALAAQPLATEAALDAAWSAASALDWDALPAHLERLLAGMAQAADPSSAAPAWPLSVPLDPRQLALLLDHPMLQRWLAMRACLQRHGPGAARGPDRRPRRPGRWRLGVLTGGRGPFGSEHTQSQLQSQAVEPALVALFDSFDPEQVDVVLYPDGPTALRHTGHEDLAARIRSDQIDLLLDLTGPGEDSRLGVLALRPAPLQVAWRGHAGTTGAPWVDYLIGDPVVTPLAAQPQFTECIAQLPYGSGPADLPPPGPPPDQPPPQRQQHGLPDTAPVLACFSPPAQITAAQFAAWCQILSAVPGAVLWLSALVPDARRRLRATAARAGLDPARLVFAAAVSPAEHLARLPLADLVLDCFPGNAEAAARQALAAGVPVVTRMGQGFAARRTASLLVALQLPALVCTDTARYVQTAVHLLQDHGARAQIQTRLAALHTPSSPQDNVRRARALQHLLARMVARHDAGLPPTPLAAEPVPGETACNATPSPPC